MVIRVCSAYRTVSLDAASLLVRTPPFNLFAEKRKSVYYRLKDAKVLGSLSLEDVREICAEERARLSGRWVECLRRLNVSGVWTIDGLLPHFEAWMG